MPRIARRRLSSHRSSGAPDHAYQDGGQTCIQVFFFRTGQNWGNRAYFPRADRSLSEAEDIEVVGAAASRFAVIEDQAEVGELFRMSAGAARPAINLFLISSSPVFLGIAGGIPGSMAVHGTRASGVALSFDDLSSAVMSGFPIEFLSVVLAHEVGHFTGLFHTSEMDGTSLEPLPDTGVCDLSRDANADGMLTFDECSGLGGDNIMFWGVSDPSSTFSSTQRDVVGAAPVLLP